MADDDLRKELQEIDGVGEKTADKIMDVLDGYQEETVPDDLEDAIMDMWDYYDAGEHEYAGEYLKDIVEYVNG